MSDPIRDAGDEASIDACFDSAANPRAPQGEWGRQLVSWRAELRAPASADTGARMAALVARRCAAEQRARRLRWAWVAAAACALFALAGWSWMRARGAAQPAGAARELAPIAQRGPGASAVPVPSTAPAAAGRRGPQAELVAANEVDRVALRLRIDRQGLLRASHELEPLAAVEPAPGGLLERLLHARVRALVARDYEPWLDDRQLAQRAAPLERALWLEILCDRYVLDGIHPSLWPSLCEGLQGPEARELPLAERALARATDLGWRCGARASAPGASAPIDSRWGSALLESLPARGDARSALVQGWVDAVSKL